MDEIGFLRDRFRRYYTHNAPEMPPRFTRREWGFMFYGGGYMARHISFDSERGVHDFFQRRVPSHAYHSTAYYKDPGASRMVEKEWMGADLIFDLDSDHLPGAEEMTYEEMLSAVKREMGKLMNDFILGDFGIDPGYVRLVFSGGRGYHLHVRDPRVLPLTSGGRREIIDYITGRGLNLDLLKNRIVIDANPKFKSDKAAVRLPSSSSPGWGGRLTRGTLAELRRIASMDDEDAMTEIMSLPGVGKKSAPVLLDRLRQDWWPELEDGNFDIFPDHFNLKRFIDGVREKARLQSLGEADEPVTTDIKRLIRVPGSLHGKTGLIVSGLTIDGFKDFDPLSDSIAFADDPMTVYMQKETKIKMKGEAFSLHPGEVQVPEHLAVFLIARRSATLRPADDAT